MLQSIKWRLLCGFLSKSSPTYRKNFLEDFYMQKSLDETSIDRSSAKGVIYAWTVSKLSREAYGNLLFVEQKSWECFICRKEYSVYGRPSESLLYGRPSESPVTVTHLMRVFSQWNIFEIFPSVEDNIMYSEAVPYFLSVFYIRKTFREPRPEENMVNTKQRMLLH